MPLNFFESAIILASPGFSVVVKAIDFTHKLFQSLGVWLHSLLFWPIHVLLDVEVSKLKSPATSLFQCRQQSTPCLCTAVPSFPLDTTVNLRHYCECCQRCSIFTLGMVQIRTCDLHHVALFNGHTCILHWRLFVSDCFTVFFSLVSQFSQRAHPLFSLASWLRALPGEEEKLTQ